MKIGKQNYSEFFIKNISPKLFIIEKERKRSVNLFLIFGGSFSALYGKITYPLFLVQGPHVILIAIPVGVLYLIFLGSFFKYKRNFKSRIIQLFFDHILEDCDFSPKGHLTESEYQSTLLYQGSYNRFTGEDLIDAIFVGTKLRMSELNVKEVKGSGKNRSEHTVFNGLMGVVNFNTNCQGEIIVEPDIAEKNLGVLGKMFQWKNRYNHEVIRLESAEFEKLFVVRASDQIEARVFLTPLVQERLVSLLKRSKINFAFSLQPGQLSVAISTSRNFFEPKYFTSNERDNTTFREILDIFLFIEEVIQLTKRV